MRLAQTTRQQAACTPKTRGFTLIETMVVTAIVAVLAALAAPSFGTTIDRWRVRQAVESMTSTLYYARSEAIKRGGWIGIQKNPKTTPGCTLAETSQEWGCGWFVFVDSDSNGTWKKGEEILQTFDTPGNVNVMHRSGGTKSKAGRYGRVSGLNAKGFTFSPGAAGVSSPGTGTICMAAGGRMRVLEEASCPKT